MRKSGWTFNPKQAMIGILPLISHGVHLWQCNVIKVKDFKIKRMGRDSNVCVFGILQIKGCHMLCRRSIGLLMAIGNTRNKPKNLFMFGNKIVKFYVLNPTKVMLNNSIFMRHRKNRGKWRVFMFLGKWKS